MVRDVSSVVQNNWRLASPRLPRCLIALGFALALGACSKCDVPNWLPNPQAPHACHDGPPAQ
jgi:hypothetical protein